MSFITDSEIQSIREAQIGFMPTELQVYRKHTAGGDSEHVAHGPAVMGRTTPNLGSLWRTAADQFVGLTMHSLTGPIGWDIRAGDQVVDVFGRMYLVRDVKNPSSYHTATQVLGEALFDA